MWYIWWFTVYSLYKEEQNVKIFTTSFQSDSWRFSWITSYRFNLFKSDFGTRYLFESYETWLEFSIFSIDAHKCINTLPKMYTVTFGCKRNALQDVIAASLAFYVPNITSATEKNVVAKFTNRISWTLHETAKCKGFLQAKF